MNENGSGDTVPNGCCHPPADHAAHVAYSERAAEDMASRLAKVQAVLTEYEDAGSLPAPYTSERGGGSATTSALVWATRYGV